LKLNVSKKGIRVLGISESFRKGVSKKSVLAGIVMRGDLLIDGFAITTITVGGLDATQGVLNIYNILNRKDINAIMLNGVIIAWYNVIDLEKIYNETKVPIIAVTYEESEEKLDKYFKENFPEDCEKRIEIYRRNGEREKIRLKTGHVVLVRYLGMRKDEAKGLLNKFVRQGAIPEPLRVSRLLARTLMQHPIKLDLIQNFDKNKL